ncbi:hypothetical protein Fot_44873 [Forsythia ovata]|uniref:Uncharacterized protein n=1 Tax=Forsythia ovata TaxID=205694 RepID=A0ABD1R8A4_9LAMI
MEDKQLNFDQPLLSVRRCSQTVASEKDNKRKTDSSLPRIPRLPHKTEVKSGPVTNPGTVPFIWEQCPGRPKEEIKPHNENSNRPPIAPKLPPGKSSKVNQQDYNKVYTSVSVNKTQAGNVPRDFQSVASLDENVNKFVKRNETIEKESSQSGDSDEAYVDALDTFSSSESIFLNCSTSGLSGSDELDVKPFGTFSMDPFSRDFMMDRFLPAAKAMSSDTTQFAPKKQPIVQEKPRQIKKIVNRDKPSMKHGPSLVKHYLQFQDNDEEEESDDDHDQHGNLPAVCGLLPRFCLKRSFCLINPVTIMRTRLPKASVNKLQGRSSAAGSFSERYKESRCNFSDQNSVGNQISLRTDFSSRSRQRENPEESSLCRQLQEHSTSISFNESPQFFHKEKGVVNFSEETNNHGINGFVSHKKGCKTFKDFLSEKDSSEESYSGIEKTLYVDTVQKVKSPSREPCPSNMQGSKELPGSRHKECEIVTKMMDQSPLVDCSLKGTNKLDTVDGAKLLLDSQKYNDITVESSISNSNKKGGMEAPMVFEPFLDFKQESTTAANVEVTHKGAKGSLQKQRAKTENREDFHQSRFQFPVPPPSPISPSESWLRRTLPSMSTKNSYLRAAANPQKQVSKAQPGDLKWETLVKTTTVQQH